MIPLIPALRNSISVCITCGTIRASASSAVMFNSETSAPAVEHGSSDSICDPKVTDESHQKRNRPGAREAPWWRLSQNTTDVWFSKDWVHRWCYGKMKRWNRRIVVTLVNFAIHSCVSFSCQQMVLHELTLSLIHTWTSLSRTLSAKDGEEIPHLGSYSSGNGQILAINQKQS